MKTSSKTHLHCFACQCLGEIRLCWHTGHQTTSSTWVSTTTTAVCTDLVRLPSHILTT